MEGNGNWSFLSGRPLAYTESRNTCQVFNCMACHRLLALIETSLLAAVLEPNLCTKAWCRKKGWRFLLCTQLASVHTPAAVVRVVELRSEVSAGSVSAIWGMGASVGMRFMCFSFHHTEPGLSFRQQSKGSLLHHTTLQKQRCQTQTAAYLCMRTRRGTRTFLPVLVLVMKSPLRTQPL